jgi:site-specific DNA-methyltransferase (adenine-specific)
MTPYYEESGITIYCGDMREIVPDLVFKSVITDPPYGETSLDWDQWVEDWPRYLLSFSGTLALRLNCSSIERTLWCFGSIRMFLNKIDEFRPWKFSQDVVWEKHNGSGFQADRFKRVHEHALHFYTGEWAKTYHQPVFTQDAIARTVRRKKRPAHMGHIEASTYCSRDGGSHMMRSVIYARSCNGTAEHPTQKPLAIVSPLIEYSCESGGLVLDPFMGSGTTLVAAKRLGRRAIGIDISEKYCEVAANRLRQSIFDFEELI